MRAAIALCLLFTACDVSAPEGPVEVLRQPAWGSPPVLLPFDAGWGSSLAACPGGGIVAGGPLASTASLLSGPVRAAGSPGLGHAVACVNGSVSEPRVLAASPQGLFQAASDGGWSSILSAPVLALSLEPSGGRLLVTEGHGAARVLLAGAFTPGAMKKDGGPIDFGAAAAWFPSNGLSRVAIGTPSEGRVDVYRLSGGTFELAFSIPGNQRPGFGRALAVGNVAHTSGDELIVGARSSVTVYDDEGRFIWEFQHPDPSFGSALAVERAPAGLAQVDRNIDSIYAFWVGAPGIDALYRYVGDAGAFDAPVNAVPAIRLGTSLAVDADNRLAAGAPDFRVSPSQQGAVFFSSINPIAGRADKCTAGLPCSVPSTCETGICVGGVVCAQLGSFCLSGQCDGRGGCENQAEPDGGTADAGTVDAGRPDAGQPDAGQPDAGQPDAGQPDAGQPDAGQPDAGQPDAGQPDAGQPDAGVMDAGATDAGLADAGRPDAGAPDAGLADAGVGDAGSSLDGGEVGPDGGVAPPERVAFTAYGCTVAGETMMLLACVILLRRRR